MIITLSSNLDGRNFRVAYVDTEIDAATAAPELTAARWVAEQFSDIETFHTQWAGSNHSAMKIDVARMVLEYEMKKGIAA